MAVDTPPDLAHGQLLAALCYSCNHFEGRDDFANMPRCPAFPNGIPSNIYMGKPPWKIPDPHFEIALGQTGRTVFEPIPGKEELREEWISLHDDLESLRLRGGPVSQDPIEESLSGPMDPPTELPVA